MGGVPDPIFSRPNIKEKIAVWLRETNSIRDLSKVSRVANAKGFHSFQLSKRNLFIENFQSQNLVQKNNSAARRLYALCMVGSSLALPDPLRTGAYRLEIISAVLIICNR